MSASQSQSQSQSQSNTSQQIERMYSLLGEILQIERENKSSDENILRIQEIILESNKFEENSTTPAEKIIDAKILHSGTNYINSNVKSFNTDLTSFDEATYVKGVSSFIENSATGIGWEALAQITYQMFRKSHPVTYMLGTFTLEPPPAKEKTRVERQRKAPGPEKRIVASVVEHKEPDEEENSVYTHIFMCLKNCYKNNDKKPLNYFNFIIDPESYWRTVENIFHFAFLVQDGCVKMTIKNGLPVIVPLFKKKLVDEKDDQEENHHFCFSLSVPEWEECIRKFDIRSASIPPFIKNN